MENTDKKILIVDDDSAVRISLEGLLEAAGYQTSSASSGEEAIKKITADRFDVVLLDIMMPYMSGIEALDELKRLGPATQIIMMTALSQQAAEAVRRGAFDYIIKPFKYSDLSTKIEKAMEKAKLELQKLPFTLR